MPSPVPSHRQVREHRQGAAATGLRLAGASYQEIATTLGIANSGEARDLVEKELALRADDAEDRAVLRREEAERIMRVLRSLWVKATDPGHPEHLPAARVALAYIDRHARLLGLDAPTEVVVYTPTTGEIDAWVTDMLTRQQAVVGEVVEADVLAIETGD